MPGELLMDQTAAISLPASLFQTITNEEDIGIFFALYNASILLPVNGGSSRNAPRRTEVGSHILAAIVGPGLNFSNLLENVTIVFELITTDSEVYSHARLIMQIIIFYFSFFFLVHSSTIRGVCFLEFYSSGLDN